MSKYFFACNKKATLLMWWPIVFFTFSHLFSVQYLFSASVTTSHYFKSFVRIFFKKNEINRIFNKMFPLSTSSNNTYGKEALINIGNSEKSSRSSTKHCNSKNFSILQNILRNVIFFSSRFSLLLSGYETSV